MYEDIDLIYKIINAVGIVGYSLIIAMAFFKGWVIPANLQAKIDAQKDTQEDEYQAKLESLYEQRRLLYEKRIADLESLIRERELRVEQNVAMLTTFIEAQDKIGQLAKRLEESHGD